MDYYDLVLGSIPISLLGIAGALSLAGIGLSIAVFAGSLVAIALIAHAMFVRAPRPATGESVQRPATAKNAYTPAD